MPLTLMYITNNPQIAEIAQKAGVDRIWIDMESLDKELRQGGMDTVQSSHTIDDIKKIRPVVTTAELQVRINHMNDNSKDEIEKVIEAGADVIMLPYFKTRKEVEKFVEYVDGRAKTIALVETKDAYENIDDILEVEGIDEIHIGLNDLHLDYGLTFMFELLSNGAVETLCQKCKAKGIKYGFGGIARLGEGSVPAEKVIMEHYRLGSTRAILSRSFCNCNLVNDMKNVEKIFYENMVLLREYEKTLSSKTDVEYAENKEEVIQCVTKIVSEIKEKSCND